MMKCLFFYERLMCLVLFMVNDGGYVEKLTYFIGFFIVLSFIVCILFNCCFLALCCAEETL